MPSHANKRILKTYQRVEHGDLPGWTTPFPTSEQPAPVRPSAHRRMPPSSTSGQHNRPTRTRVEEAGWDALSDASGTEENGVDGKYIKRTTSATKPNAETFRGNQKKRMQEQAEINQRAAQQEMKSGVKTHGGVIQMSKEQKAGWFSWLPWFSRNAN